MMKKLLFLALGAALTGACHNEKNGQYRLSGSFESGQSGDTVLLLSQEDLLSAMQKAMDTAIIDKDGKFHFQGTTEGAETYFLALKPKDSLREEAFADFILENANINISIPKPEDNKSATVESDGPAYQIYKKVEERNQQLVKETQPIYAALTNKKASKEEIKQMEEQMRQITNKHIKWVIRTVIDNAPSTFSDMMLPQIRDVISPEQMDTLIQKLKQAKEKMPNYEKLKTELEAEKQTNTGKQYTELEMKDPQGKDMKLSQYVGKSKLLLVDFWASWCGPCRAEMPNVVEAYKKFHDKGLEIIGVSLDKEVGPWKEALKTLNMNWPQMSDLKGWQSQAVERYHIRGIPNNVLLDSKGTIVAKDLREEELHTTIEKLLK